jgi:DNA-binding CsgD family transcriptional regulator
MSATTEQGAREALHRAHLDHVQQPRELTGQELRADGGDRQTLHLLGVGLTRRQIRTWRQLGRIDRKLGVSGRAQAAVRSLELGLARANNVVC